MQAYNSGGLTTDADYPEASNVPPFANGACQTLLIQSPLYGAAQAPGYVEVYGEWHQQLLLPEE